MAGPALVASVLEAPVSFSMTIVSFSVEVEMVIGLLPEVVVVAVEVVLVCRLVGVVVVCRLVGVVLVGR